MEAGQARRRHLCAERFQSSLGLPSLSLTAGLTAFGADGTLEYGSSSLLVIIQ